MKLFKKILVPYDFSDCAKNALREAIKLVQKYDGEVTLMHVLHSGTTTGDIAEAKKRMEEDLNEISLVENVDGGVIVKTGLPAEEIALTIDRDNYSLCIMGTNKRHDIISELAGTHALQIMKRVKAPLIVIPGDQHLSDIHRMVFATDFKKLTRPEILYYIRDIALAFNSELHLLNVSDAPESYSVNEAEEALDLHHFFEETNHAFFFSREEDPVDGITKYVRDKHINLLVMMPRKHAFFDSVINDSVSDRIALQLSVPLFSLHE